MTKEEVIAWALAHGWEKYSPGILQMEALGEKYRLNFCRNVIHFEKQIIYCTGIPVWVILTSVYYSSLVNNLDAYEFYGLLGG
jgi:hypothetical protein